jgi:hypothetical protein
MQLFAQLLNDEAGFIVSAELILIATIVVISMVVGLSEVSFAINSELNDVANAFGSMNQSYRYSGVNGQQGQSSGGGFTNGGDFGAGGQSQISSQAPSPE